MVNLNEVLVFVRVVECGSFSQAAQQLGQPRATVSRKVSQLESTLGIRLLQRSTRKLSLTEAGRQYYLRCSGALAEIADANEAVTASQQKPSGLLRISAPLAAQTGFMCNMINEFLDQYPDVSVKVVLTDDVVNLIDEGIDVAFRAGKLKDSSLVARKLGSTRLVLCASPGYVRRSSALAAPKELKQHTCILYGDAKKHLSWLLERREEQLSVPVSGRVTVNSMQFALHSCLSGLGVALLPHATVKAYLDSGELLHLLPEYSSNIGGFYIVYPSKSHLSTTVRTFIDFVAVKSEQGLDWREEG